MTVCATGFLDLPVGDVIEGRGHSAKWAWRASKLGTTGANNGPDGRHGNDAWRQKHDENNGTQDAPDDQEYALRGLTSSPFPELARRPAGSSQPSVRMLDTQEITERRHHSLSGRPVASLLIDPVRMSIPSIKPHIQDARAVMPNVMKPSNPSTSWTIAMAL